MKNKSTYHSDYLQFIFYLLIAGIISACSTTKKAQNVTNDTNGVRSTGQTEAVSEYDPKNNTLELADYLRRVPGVQVSGPKSHPVVRVRTSISVSGSMDPLYVIDNTPVGNSYESAAQQVDVNDIKTIRVLKDVSSTNAYGMRGANGVIVIITKKK